MKQPGLYCFKTMKMAFTEKLWQDLWRHFCGFNVINQVIDRETNSENCLDFIFVAFLVRKLSLCLMKTIHSWRPIVWKENTAFILPVKMCVPVQIFMLRLAILLIFGRTFGQILFSR